MTNLNQNGRSMIEMLGVLAIIGVLSVGGIAGYSKAMMKFKTNKTIDQIAMTVTNIRTLYAQQTTYKGLVTSNAYAMGVADDAMGTTGTLENPFGGSYYISSAKSGAAGETEGGWNGAFLITATGLPREACVAIATNDWGSGYSSGLLGIGTGYVPASTTWNLLDYVISDAYAADPAPADTSVDANALDIKCDVNGATTSGSNGTNIQKVACARGVTSAAMTVATAAEGCNCGTKNTCIVTFKYY